ncbi:hypothetical protein CCACVL1_02995, partial [Corchorus capsularis]
AAKCPGFSPFDFVGNVLMYTKYVSNA